MLFGINFWLISGNCSRTMGKRRTYSCSLKSVEVRSLNSLNCTYWRGPVNFSKIFRSKKHTKKGLIDLNGLYIIYFVIIIYIPRNGRVHYIYIHICTPWCQLNFKRNWSKVCAQVIDVFSPFLRQATQAHPIHQSKPAKKKNANLSNGNSVERYPP